MTASYRLLAVTGAAGDLGRSIATTFATSGWRVALLDVDTQRLGEAAQAAGGRAYNADVTRPQTLSQAFGKISAELGYIDCLVNAAGLTRPAPSESLPDDDWQTVLDVNLSGAFFSCRAALPHLRPSGASVINISSISATRVLPGRAAYSASKAGLNGLTSSLAVEWASRGLRVNAVAPAWIDNTFLRSLADRGVLDPSELASKIPLGRLCTNEDVVAAVEFLADLDKSGFITGQVLHVDGGYLPAG
jgi:NAD(P)-dependent dehydrogenase (short-subunit alcohol dehydrogenase family)